MLCLIRKPSRWTVHSLVARNSSHSRRPFVPRSTFTRLPRDISEPAFTSHRYKTCLLRLYWKGKANKLKTCNRIFNSLLNQLWMKMQKLNILWVCCGIWHRFNWMELLCPRMYFPQGFDWFREIVREVVRSCSGRCCWLWKNSRWETLKDRFWSVFCSVQGAQG